MQYIKGNTQINYIGRNNMQKFELTLENPKGARLLLTFTKLTELLDAKWEGIRRGYTVIEHDEWGTQVFTRADQCYSMLDDFANVAPINFD